MLCDDDEALAQGGRSVHADRARAVIYRGLRRWLAAERGRGAAGASLASSMRHKLTEFRKVDAIILLRDIFPGRWTWQVDHHGRHKSYDQHG